MSRVYQKLQLPHKLKSTTILLYFPIIDLVLIPKFIHYLNHFLSKLELMQLLIMRKILKIKYKE